MNLSKLYEPRISNPNFNVTRFISRVSYVRTLLEYITHVVVDALGQVFEVFMMIMEYLKWSIQESTLKQATIAVNDGLEL